MKKYLSLLKRSKLFSGIIESEIDNMLDCLEASKRKFSKGEYIFRIGEHVTMVAMVLEGSVHIQKEDYWGNLSILNEISEGEIFGESFAAPGSEPISNDVVSVEDSVILFMDFNRILNVCTTSCRYHNLLIQNLFALISQKNRILAQKLGHMSQRTTREKLLSYLSEQSRKAGSAAFDVPFNRQQLADFLSVDRSAMSNELSKMREEGILIFNKSHFILK